LGACGDENNPRETDPGELSAHDGGDEPTPDDDASPSNDAGAQQKDAGRRSDASPGDAGEKPVVPVDAGSGVADAGASTTSDAGAVASGNDVPAGEHCAPVASWDAKSTQFEEEVLKLTNEARAAGHNCDTEGSFAATTPLKMQSQLRCSSRLHSKYMAETGDFNHTQTATMLDPFQRMKAAGYVFRAAGENIAAGQQTPKQVVDGWLDSDGHCRNIMDPGFTEIGVGYVVSKAGTGIGGRATPYWTQNFGKPAK
jgi:uncharacterized protein YkwD